MKKNLQIFFLFCPLFLFADLNDDFISYEMSNIDKLIKNASFIEGEIYFENDTITADILDFKKKSDRNFYLFIIVKKDNGEMKSYSAKQISGYKIKDNYFRKVESGNDSYFIKRTNLGKIVLFQRKMIPSEKIFLYFLLKGDKMFVLDPAESNVKNDITVETGDGNTFVTILELKGLELMFQGLVNEVMFDCDKVKNLVKSGFYTINDLPYLVDTYNEFSSE